MLRDNQEISNGEFSLLDRYYKMATSNLTELQVDKEKMRTGFSGQLGILSVKASHQN